jgi:hypothetical protein
MGFRENSENGARTARIRALQARGRENVTAGALPGFRRANRGRGVRRLRVKRRFGPVATEAVLPDQIRGL